MAMKPGTRFEPELPERDGLPPWAEAVRRELDADAAALDGAARSRLNRARQAALAEAGRSRWLAPRLWLPAGAAAALALSLVLQPVVDRPGPARADGAAAGAVEDLELLRQGESLELYEDQEFYAWLDASEPAPG
jgi:hypothetical protein